MMSILDIDHALFLLLNGSGSIVLDKFALTETSHFAWVLYVFSIIYLIVKNNKFKHTLLILSLLVVLYLLTDTLVASFIQPTIGRLRPTTDLTFCHQVDVVNQLTGGIHGFFSNQVAKVLGFSVFLSMIFKSWSFFGFSMFWSLLHAWVLIYLGYYFPSDILVGFLWGGAVAALLYLFYMKIGPKIVDFHVIRSDQFTLSGYYHADILFLNVTFLLNLIAILIWSFINF